MGRNIQFRELDQQILRVSSSKKGMSSYVITELVRKFYPINCAPSQPTVWRWIQKLVSEGVMYENDAGYLKKEDDKFTLQAFADIQPIHQLWNEIANCLIILADDPVESAEGVKEIVDKRLMPVVIGTRVLIDVLDRISQSPELMGYVARNTDQIREALEFYEEEDKEKEATFGPDGYVDWRMRFWNASDTYGEYYIGTGKEESA